MHVLDRLSCERVDRSLHSRAELLAAWLYLALFGSIYLPSQRGRNWVDDRRTWTVRLVSLAMGIVGETSGQDRTQDQRNGHQSDDQGHLHVSSFPHGLTSQDGGLHPVCRMQFCNTKVYSGDFTRLIPDSAWLRSRRSCGRGQASRLCPHSPWPPSIA